MITYTNDLSGVKAETFVGFFEGWVQKPTPEQHLEILRHSAFCWLAFAGTRCVGFINAISDGFFYAAIPLLEVVPEYRGKGIGAELIRVHPDFVTGTPSKRYKQRKRKSEP